VPQPLDVETISTSSRSDVGRTRSENQDSCGDFLHLAGARLLILADGMGGHKGGRQASRTCVDAFARVFQSQRGGPEQQLRDGFSLANDEIYSAALEDESLRGMGTTGVALLLAKDGTALVGWVGDSRAYRWRAGRLEQLTEDHSLVAEWVRMGVLSQEEAAKHPRRSELTRAIGVQPDVEAEVRPLDICPGDRFLLCSDGLSGLVAEPQIASILGGEDAERAVETLVDRANALGGTDNVSVQIAVLPGTGDQPEAPPPPRVEEEIMSDLLAGDDEEEPAPHPRPAPAPPVVITEPRGIHSSSAAVGATVAIVVLTIAYFALGPPLRTDPNSTPPTPIAMPAPVQPAPAPTHIAPEPADEPGELIATEETNASGPLPSPTPSESAEPPPAESAESSAPAPAPVEPVAETPGDAEPAPVAQIDPPPLETPNSEDEPAPILAVLPEEPEPAAEIPGSVVPLDKAPMLGPVPQPLAENTPPPAALDHPPAALHDAPIEIPTTEGFALQPPLRGFLDDWLRAAAMRDFRLYNRLGFPDSPDLFSRTYGSWEAFRFEDIAVDEARSSEGRIYVRAVLSYVFEDASGRWRTEDEHRLILRESADGLHYEARWK
jgi:protein phosphatase